MFKTRYYARMHVVGAPDPSNAGDNCKISKYARSSFYFHVRTDINTYVNGWKRIHGKDFENLV